MTERVNPNDPWQAVEEIILRLKRKGNWQKESRGYRLTVWKGLGDGCWIELRARRYTQENAGYFFSLMAHFFLEAPTESTIFADKKAPDKESIITFSYQYRGKERVPGKKESYSLLSQFSSVEIPENLPNEINFTETMQRICQIVGEEINKPAGSPLTPETVKALKQTLFVL